MYDLEKLQQVLKPFNNPKDPDAQEALEEYERPVVRRNRLIYKLEDIEYPDVSSTKW